MTYEYVQPAFLCVGLDELLRRMTKNNVRICYDSTTWALRLDGHGTLATCTTHASFIGSIFVRLRPFHRSLEVQVGELSPVPHLLFK